MNAVEPPAHVLATFGLRSVQPVPLDDWGGAWRCGDLLLTPVADHARAAWSAKVRESLRVDGVRLARPVRGTDGRYVVSGWRADTHIAGTAEPRYDEVVSLSLRLHQATASLERPRFLGAQPLSPWGEIDVFAVADNAAWDPAPARSVQAAGGVGTTPDCRRSLELLVQLSTLRRPVQAAPQLVHGDLFGTVLFAGPAEPGLTDLTPYWRPVVWAAAVIVVDAVSWGGADAGLLDRWSDLPEWPQMLLRAVLFRLAVHTLHPRSTPDALAGLAHTADMIRLRL
ncbi:TIGR02569 family protein [Nocardia stercoris]|uniref:TIGR02569 family protein n=1 Tax=Nocardia stercoris TaxID=2483361 RepID=A0A3M2LC74_9NOCA|nr:TIGR02569 family protein [Nocardia stercoris]RMI35152.1 TIGR02569 family protein [Nocardia stercoris]